MSAELSAAEVEALDEALCPGCGHNAFYHHPIGSCSVTTYGAPEDGFQPATPCTCDWPFADALAPTVAALVAQAASARERAAKAEGRFEGIRYAADIAETFDDIALAVPALRFLADPAALSPEAAS